MQRYEWTIDFVTQLAQPTDPGTDRRAWALGYLQGGVRLFNGLRVVLGNLPIAASLTALPDLAPGVTQRYYILWTARPNPSATSAADAVLSDLRVVNLDTGNDAATSFVNTISPTTTATFVSLGATILGTLPWAGGDPSIVGTIGFFVSRAGFCRCR